MSAGVNSGALIAATQITHQNPTYSASNLPDLLFRLEAPEDWGTATYNSLQDQNGQILRKANGRPYQDFPWLPNQIPIQPEAFLLEFWNKTHPDCSYADFEIRMHPGHNERLPARNALNMRRIREVRLPLNIPSWLRKGDRVTLTDCLIFESLSLNSVQRNTVLPVRPWGLVKPTLRGAPALAMNHNPAVPPAPPAPLPLQTFTDGKEKHIASEKLQEIKKLTAFLQDTAFERMLAHWIFLRDEEKPSWWNEQTSDSNKDNISIPLTHALPHAAREWIKECVREAGEVGSDSFVPPVTRLPKWAQRWVTECLKEGRARGSIPPTDRRGNRGWSLDVAASDDSYISKLSLSLTYPEEQRSDQADCSDYDSSISNHSGVSEIFSVLNSMPEASERSEASWTHHWRTHYRDKAIAEALKTGKPGEAVILAQHTGRVKTADRRFLVFKNLLVVPENSNRVDKRDSNGTHQPELRRSQNSIEETGSTIKQDTKFYDLVAPPDLYEHDDGPHEQRTERIGNAYEEREVVILAEDTSTFEAGDSWGDNDDLYGVSDREE